MKETKEDRTSLGNILLDWGLVSRDQLDHAIYEQKTLKGDALLGKLLIANGFCTETDIVEAMVAQASLRAAGKHQAAMAVANFALKRKRRDSIVVQQDRIIKKGEEVMKSITDEYPVITGALLVKHTRD